MSFLEIEPGDVEELVSATDTTEYLAQVFNEGLEFGESEHEAQNAGMRRVAGDEGPLEAADGTPVYVHNPGTETAEVRMQQRGRGTFFDDDDEGIRFDRNPRDTIAGVLGSTGSVSAPRSDAFVQEQATGVGIGGQQSTTVPIQCPARADFIHIAVDDASDTFEVTIEFQDAEGNEVVSVGPNESGNLSGSPTDPVFHREAVFAEDVAVTIADTSNNANSIDYSIYAR